MTWRPLPTRLLASWVFLVLAASTVVPLRGEWNEGRLAPWNASATSGGILDSVEQALPGVLKISRGWSGFGEGRWGKDLLELTASLPVFPATFFRAEWQFLSPTEQLSVRMGLGFETLTLHPRPPPSLSAVL